MAWTTAEETRVAAIERVLNTLQKLVQNVPSLDQLRQQRLLRQKEISSLQAQVDSLKSQVETLQGST